MSEPSIVLEAKGITKQFPGVLANDTVDFDLHLGEVHALLGENGAGKTTLMNILYGLYKQDAGEIKVNKQPIAIHSSKDSIGAGIGMVHQHFMLIPVFTVAENIMLGDEGTGINAGFWRRFCALFIDALLLTTAFFLLEFLLNHLGGALLSLVLLPFLGIILAWLYFAGLESSTKQATFGKQAFGLIVTNENGERLSYKVATLRFLAKILSGLPFAAGYVMVAFTANKQALHDKLVHTLVVDVGGGILDRKTVENRVRELSKQYRLDVDPTALVGQLPVGVQQRVEIIKTLYRNANILILDEPTAVLTPQEADDLFGIIRELTQRGVSVIFITHKLKEVLAIADRITVMRAHHDGRSRSHSQGGKKHRQTRR
ncbi:MAG: ATP-binding cassette domain-containing protein [Chloroflexi bacterium]|nr:ATP-binding cassette domain-containing protein [Chloroflexota bacterium]